MSIIPIDGSVPPRFFEVAPFPCDVWLEIIRELLRISSHGSDWLWAFERDDLIKRQAILGNLGQVCKNMYSITRPMQRNCMYLFPDEVYLALEPPSASKSASNDLPSTRCSLKSDDMVVVQALIIDAPISLPGDFRGDRFQELFSGVKRLEISGNEGLVLPTMLKAAPVTLICLSLPNWDLLWDDLRVLSDTLPALEHLSISPCRPRFVQGGNIIFPRLRELRFNRPEYMQVRLGLFFEVTIMKELKVLSIPWDQFQPWNEEATMSISQMACRLQRLVIEHDQTPNVGLFHRLLRISLNVTDLVIRGDVDWPDEEDEGCYENVQLIVIHFRSGVRDMTLKTPSYWSRKRFPNLVTVIFEHYEVNMSKLCEKWAKARFGEVKVIMKRGLNT